jgi:predicted RNA-binding protein with PUA-like domain
MPKSNEKILGENDQIRVKSSGKEITIEHLETGEEESWDVVINFRAVGERDLRPKDMKLLYSVDKEVATILEA